MATIVEIARDDDLTTPLLSLSAWCALGAMQSTNIDCCDSTCVKIFVVIPLMEAGMFLAGVVGVIEAVFWGAIAVLAKAVHVFIPKSWETANSIYASLVGRALIPVDIAITCFCFATMIFCKEQHKIDKIVKSTGDCFANFCAPFFNYQLFDGTASK